MPLDQVGLLETLYRVVRPRHEWLSAALTAIQPLIDPHRLGLVGGFLSIPDPSALRPELIQTHGMSDRHRTFVLDGSMHQMTPVFIADAFLSRAYGTSAQIQGWEDIPIVKSGAIDAVGVRDTLAVSACEPNGDCVYVTSLQPDVVHLSDKDRVELALIARHLNAAHRLIRSVGVDESLMDRAAAVLDPDGRVHHARGAARSAMARKQLQRAVHSIEGARGRMRRSEPLQAIADWQSVVDNRWTLLEQVESDGKRYLLAVENMRAPPSPALLSVREREVVGRALAGCHNKLIAYELGLSDSTVRVLMGRAAAKLGVRTRKALLEVVARTCVSRHPCLQGEGHAGADGP